MDLTTDYLGFTLKSPLVASASPLSDDVDNIKRMEDSGASAVVLYSLFEEQIIHDQEELYYHTEAHNEAYAESITFYPDLPDFQTGPEQYLDHIRKAKEAVGVPVIASLNGSSLGGWTQFSKRIEEAGADALELNIYSIPTDIDTPGSEVEERYVEVVKAVKAAINIPVAVKISPFFSNMANMAKKLDEAGADGLVLFNRFYQPDIDLETLEVKPNVLLSTPQALRLPLRWVAILYGRISADLAATSGVHGAADAIKLLMAGAKVTMMASATMRYGLGHFETVETGMRLWMEHHEYESVKQMQGSMSQKNVEDPGSFERAQYMRAVSTLPKQYR